MHALLNTCRTTSVAITGMLAGSLATTSATTEPPALSRYNMNVERTVSTIFETAYPFGSMAQSNPHATRPKSHLFLLSKGENMAKQNFIRDKQRPTMR